MGDAAELVLVLEPPDLEVEDDWPHVDEVVLVAPHLEEVVVGWPHVDEVVVGWPHGFGFGMAETATRRVAKATIDLENIFAT